MEKDLNIGILNEIYGALLTQTQRESIKSYYDCDLSFGEIAENCGISRQAVRDSVEKGKASLLHYESVLGMENKLLSIKSALEDCLSDGSVESIKKKIGEIIKNI